MVPKHKDFLMALATAKTSKERMLILRGSTQVQLLFLASLIKGIVRSKIPLKDPTTSAKRLKKFKDDIRAFVANVPALRKNGR